MRPSRLAAWLTIAPAALLFAGIALAPVVELVSMSTSEVAWVRGRPRWTEVGFDHYARVLQDGLFRAGLRNTVVFAVIAVAIQMLLGFALALMTTKALTGRIFYRTVFILPILVPGIVIGAIWKLMYNFDFGVLNQILGVFGYGPVNWLGDTGTALAAVIVVDVWHWTPFVFLLMLAGLEGLPQDVYEAAKVDGATFWQELGRITLPLMLPTILVTLLFRLIVAFKVFDEIYLLTAGGPGTATEVVSFTVYRRFFTEGQMGYGSAMSVVVLTALAVVIVVAVTGTRRREAAA
jgi:multiple sugar transport system permease protein